MSELVDAKGLACPEPVIRTKKALDVCDDVTVLVDNETALENVKRLASSSGCTVEVKEESGGIFRLDIKKGAGNGRTMEPLSGCPGPQSTAEPAGPSVFVFASNVMGSGSDALGTILMKAFIHTVVELERRPDVMIFYNTGVKLAASDSDVIDDLKALEAKGAKLLVCGTCVNFFELTGKVGAGTVSNMYDIAGTLSTAGRIVKP
jgi:selenium metabolism protein YedF